jgi:hypothetical protein
MPGGDNALILQERFVQVEDTEFSSLEVKRGDTDHLDGLRYPLLDRGK